MVVTHNPDATVRALSRDDMLAERDELLREAGVTEDELRARGDAYELNAEERGILARIDGLDFLLEHTPA